MSIAQKQAEVVETFEPFKTWEQRYQYIVKLGKELSPLPQEYQTEKYQVKGCQSQVWLHAKLEKGKVIYEADSDALIVKGIVALLVNVFSNEIPQDILDAKLQFLDDIGLRQHLSMNRSNGLAAMVKQIKMYALAFSTQV